MPYGHLTIEEREMIAKLKGDGFSQSQIAKRLKRNKSTINRELKRNAISQGYFPAQAQTKADKRRVLRRHAYKLDHPDLLRDVFEMLEKDWSPEQVSGVLRKQYKNQPHRCLSHTSIYALIWEDKKCCGNLYTHLRQAHRKRRKRYGTGDRRGCIRNRKGIEERPKVVENRSRLGDWEGDTMEGKKGSGLLAVHVERKASYTVIAKLPDKRAETLNRVTAQAFKRHDDLPRHTLTVDNGREFAEHEKLSKSIGVDIYFANPYHPWERGLSENTNGLIRQYFPKGMDLSKVNHSYVRKVERILNTRPRKKLGYRTPEDVLRRDTVALQI